VSGSAGPALHWSAFALAALVLLPFSAAGDPIEHIEHPTKVPAFESFLSLGNGIEPGNTGTYGFTLRNRYNGTMENVSLTVEVYRWATVEEARAVDQFALPPVFVETGRLDVTRTLATLPPNATYPVTLEVRTAPPTPEGVYFTRHSVAFDYPNFTVPGNATPRLAHFTMKSRGFFTAEEFESINYTDLQSSLAALGVAGIVPDSSFSVKRPASIWPLVFVAGATAVTGGLSFAMYLADMHPERFPQVKRALLRLAGKAHIARELSLGWLRDRFGRSAGATPPRKVP
jgi:hypothetical protein